MPQTNKITQSIAPKQLARVYGQLKIATLMQLGAQEFSEYIAQVEDDPLFKRLMYAHTKDKRSQKVIGFSRFAKTEFVGSLYQEDSRLKDTKVPDVESLLEAKKEVVEIVKKIGSEDFKKYFLYSDFDLSIEDVALKCGIPSKEVEKIIELVNDLSIKNRFYTASSEISSAIKYTKVATLYKKKGDFIIGFFDLQLARGKYSIDQDRLKRLKDEGVFSKKELVKIQSLLGKLRLINLRKSTLFRILDLVVKKQKRYLESGDLKDLIPLSQKQAASLLEVSPSLFSRAIGFKSIQAPWAKELPLKHFFPRLKEVRLCILESLLEQDRGAGRDEDIKSILSKEYGIFISRRTISKYRKELGIGPLKNR